jgi:hypothetical protein
MKGGEKNYTHFINRILNSGETNMNLLLLCFVRVHVTLENSQVRIKCQIWYLKQNK